LVIDDDGTSEALDFPQDKSEPAAEA